MGLEASTIAYLGLALSAAGAGASAYNTNRTAAQQDQEAARGINAQAQKQRQIDERVSQEIGALENSSPEDERKLALDKYLSQLRTARGNASGDLGAAPEGSRYGADVATSQAGIQNFGEKVAGILARIGAARDQRLNEGYAIGRMGSDTASIAREAQGQDFLNRLRLGNIRRNPWIDAGSSVLQGIGSGMALNGGAADEALTPVDITARRIPTSSGAWAGRVPQPGVRFG